MKILNELVELANKANSAGYGTPEMVEFRVVANPDSILAIAEAFRALELRAEAAEAKYSEVSDWYAKMKTRMLAAETKLAELEKQAPYGTLINTFLATDPRAIAEARKKGMQTVEVFTRPAPAINMAELVPHCLVDAMSNLNLEGVSIGDKAIIGKAIEVLRNIEEAK